MTEQDRFQLYKQTTNQPNLTIEDFRQRAARFQPVAKVVDN